MGIAFRQRKGVCRECSGCPATYFFHRHLFVLLCENERESFVWECPACGKYMEIGVNTGIDGRDVELTQIRVRRDG